jgi:hypothetical protein
MMEITSSPGPLEEAAKNMAPVIPTKALHYEDIPHCAEWLSSIHPSPERIVIADFGGRDGALDTLVETYQEATELHSAKVTVIAVGNQQKVCALIPLLCR